LAAFRTSTEAKGLMFGEFAAKDVILKRVHESLARSSGTVGVDDAPQVQVCRAPDAGLPGLYLR
jgi:hypothetical protein